jgi:hypothetical protein
VTQLQQSEGNLLLEDIGPYAGQDSAPETTPMHLYYAMMPSRPDPVLGDHRILRPPASWWEQAEQPKDMTRVSTSPAPTISQLTGIVGYVLSRLERVCTGSVPFGMSHDVGSSLAHGVVREVHGLCHSARSV